MEIETKRDICGDSRYKFSRLDLAVDIENSGLNYVKTWITKNAEQFGLVREYDFELWYYTYIKSREGIPARVLEIENLPPESTYSAEQIEKLSGGKWLKKLPKIGLATEYFMIVRSEKVIWRQRIKATELVSGREKSTLYFVNRRV